MTRRSGPEPAVEDGQFRHSFWGVLPSIAATWGVGLATGAISSTGLNWLSAEVPGANDTPEDGIIAQRGEKRSRLSLVGVGLVPASSRRRDTGLFRNQRVEDFLVEGADEFERADHRSILVGGCSLTPLSRLGRRGFCVNCLRNRRHAGDDHRQRQAADYYYSENLGLHSC